MNLSKIKMNQTLRAFFAAVLFVTSFASLVSAQEATATETAQTQSTTLRSKQVTGSLEGGKFAKIWLELQPDAVSSRVTLLAEFSTANLQQDGVGFFVLDASNFSNVLGGGSLISNNVAAGNPSTTTNSNQLEVAFNADSTSPYTVVIVNDGASNVSFTLTATNATIVDGSGQVTDPNAAPASSAQPPAAVTDSATVAATATPAVAATETTTTTTTAEATPEATTVATTAAPAAATSVLRATTVEGELPNQYDQHFLGLEPSQRDASIKLSLTVNPQDNSEVLRKVSFVVLNEDGFRAYLDGQRATSVAVAAGNRVFDGPSNLSVANFTSVGSSPMTVIVYNNSEFAASYELTVEGATLVDDSGQTLTAQRLAPTTTVSTTTEAASTPVSTRSATTTTTSTATTAAAGAPAIGSSYTIKSGDSISKIARDVYGDVQLYDELCAYNKITSCDTIEVGDTIQLPARSELGTGATTTVQPTPTPTRAPAAAASTTVTSTQTTTNTATTPVTSTTTLTETEPVTATETTTDTTSSEASTGSNDTIIGVAEANGSFTILLDLLSAAGLETNLDSEGSFTVFAPTDAAFSALPAGAIDQLKRNPQGQLRQILLYHVLSNAVTSDELEDGMEATTLQGGTVKFTVSGSQVKVQDSVISPADVQASNGVIHVIDKVMLPPAQ